MDIFARSHAAKAAADRKAADTARDVKHGTDAKAKVKADVAAKAKAAEPAKPYKPQFS